MSHSILVLNTGSTSTKLAIYINRKKADQKEYVHDRVFLEGYPYMADQLPMRQKIAADFVKAVAAPYAPFSAIVARGGILCPVRSGGYVINDEMVKYLLNVCAEEHASNVAACIAYELAKEFQIPNAYIYDGISTDELEPIARISGIPELPRVSITHCLNMRAIAHKAAEDLGKKYNECSIIVAHLGGGISLTLHKNGRIVDVLGDDEGPFSPERAGGQQGIQLIKLVRKKTELRDQLRIMRGDSGLIGYFDTSDAREIECLIDSGNQEAALVYEAMAYQIAKGIAGLATVVYGKPDCICLTGGLAYSDMLTEWIRERTAFIGPIRIYPGENEMESLALGAYRILCGEEESKTFSYDTVAVRQ